MLRIVLPVIISFVLLSCGTSTTPEGLENYFPQGSIIEAYDDIPGLVRVTVKAPNGRLSAEGDFMNGVNHGPWTEYDTTRGFVTSIKTYYLGKLQGVTMEFERGSIVSKSYYHNNELNGQVLTMDRRGITEEKNYSDGVLEGMVRKFYSNGSVMEEAPYTNGVLDGLAKWYDQEGNLKFQYLYEDGKLIDQNPQNQ